MQLIRALRVPHAAEAKNQSATLASDVCNSILYTQQVKYVRPDATKQLAVSTSLWAQQCVLVRITNAPLKQNTACRMHQSQPTVHLPRRVC